MPNVSTTGVGGSTPDISAAGEYWNKILAFSPPLQLDINYKVRNTKSLKVMLHIISFAFVINQTFFCLHYIQASLAGFE